MVLSGLPRSRLTASEQAVIQAQSPEEGRLIGCEGGHFLRVADLRRGSPVPVARADQAGSALRNGFTVILA